MGLPYMHLLYMGHHYGSPMCESSMYVVMRTLLKRTWVTHIWVSQIWVSQIVKQLWRDFDILWRHCVFNMLRVACVRGSQLAGGQGLSGCCLEPVRIWHKARARWQWLRLLGEFSLTYREILLLNTEQWVAKRRQEVWQSFSWLCWSVCLWRPSGLERPFTTGSPDLPKSLTRPTRKRNKKRLPRKTMKLHRKTSQIWWVQGLRIPTVPERISCALWRIRIANLGNVGC